MKEYNIALKTVKKSGLILKKYFGKVGYKLKGPANPVTVADLLSQEEIVKAVRREFPGDSFLAEENLSDFKNTDRVWILDPLDGTLNYAHGFPHFAISLAFCLKGKPVLGIIYDTAKNELFTTQKGKGSFLNGKKISVSKTAYLKDSLLATGFAYDRAEKADYYCSYYADFMKISHDIRRAGAASLDMAWTACGRLDGYWEFNLKPWDVAAGRLLAEEAGGKITDFSGKPWGTSPHELKNWGVQTLCSNSKIHSQMLSRLVNLRG